MAKLNVVWVFFTHNAGDAPLDFAVVGNLGSDGSGSVTEYTFEAAPYLGFVKRECCAGDDPSINHLVVVDGFGAPGAQLRPDYRWSVQRRELGHRR